jgi:hypothetical protein
MSSNDSPDSVLLKHEVALGRDLGRVYHELWNECSWLHAKWQEYVILFGTSPERVELLNSAAGFFFRVVQDVLWEDILLHLARMTDSPRSAGKRNLTLRSLTDLIDDDGLRVEVSALNAEAVRATGFARDWRNRHIAHRDFDLALNAETVPLEAASHVAVTAALKALGDVLNHISVRLTDSTIIFDVVTPFTGAEKLLRVVHDGVRVDEARRERLRTGRFTEDDLRSPPGL